MKVERSDQQDLTPEEQAHLAKLKQLVEDALADGRLSQSERNRPRNLTKA
ncbi:hypothetical protein [Leptolyngbya sp. KIOST-1]|nr:hypothetical protein [Leptolyngbya sp. KIOST-1]